MSLRKALGSMPLLCLPSPKLQAQSSLELGVWDTLDHSLNPEAYVETVPGPIRQMQRAWLKMPQAGQAGPRGKLLASAHPFVDGVCLA